MINRREFLLSSGAFAFPFITGCANFGYRANEKVNVAVIGIGARGAEDVESLEATGIANFVAFADTEIRGEWTASVRKAYPNVPCFDDFRKMFDKMGDQIDAVLVATPDHSHFAACMAAMQCGKSVYTEKPMGNTFREIQVMIDMAVKNPKLVTQMGNQGHSLANYYQSKEMAKRGLFDGAVKVVAHMNNGRRWHKWNGSVREMFPAGEAAPDYVNWDAWLAQRPNRPYNINYIHGDWRSFYEYGNGALGDWGAHTFDTAHEFLQLGLPESVGLINISGWTPVVFPMSSALSFKFPARSAALPACELQWWEGVGNLPTLPKGFRFDMKSETPFIGGVVDAKKTKLNPGREIYLSNGKVYQGTSHGAQLYSCDGDKLPSFAEVYGDGYETVTHTKNFLRAVRGEVKTTSPFEIAGVLSQVMTIGCIAQKLQAKSLSFDRTTKRFTAGENKDVANALLDGPAPRKEWEQYYKV